MPIYRSKFTEVPRQGQRRCVNVAQFTTPKCRIILPKAEEDERYRAHDSNSCPRIESRMHTRAARKGCNSGSCKGYSPARALIVRGSTPAGGRFLQTTCNGKAGTHVPSKQALCKETSFSTRMIALRCGALFQ